MQIAMGSASELEYHLLLALLDQHTTEVKRMLAGFIQKLRGR
jgi:hypothetical protein